jgi:hypothetical protein
MNCKQCNATIDYNYLTACPQCGSAVEGGNLPQAGPDKKKSAWLYYVGNIIYVLMTSAVGAYAGSICLIFVAVALCKVFLPPPPHPGAYCALGDAIGWFSIITGAFLGTVAGTVFTIKRPILTSRRPA